MDWTAEWIWYGPGSDESDYMLARRPFVLDQRPERCPVVVSADNRYKLYVNGKPVCRGPVRCGGRYQYYDEIDLAPFLAAGKNVLAVLVHHYGIATSRLLNGRAGFILQGECPNGKAGAVPLNTGECHWKVRKGTAWFSPVVRVSVCLPFPEIIDLGKLPDEWTRADFDDSDWNEPYSLGSPPVAPWEIMLPRDIPFLTEKMADLTPEILSIRKAAALPAVRTVDLGLIYGDDLPGSCGYLLLFLRTDADREAMLHYDADGKVSLCLDGREMKGASSEGMKTLPLALTRGIHRLLVKVVKESFHWTFSYTWSRQEGIRYEDQSDRWRVIGPFGGDADHSPEHETDLAKDYPGLCGRVRWQPTTARLNMARQMTWEVPGADLILDRRFPLRIPACPSGECTTITVDLGREITGFPRLELECADAGTVVDLGYAETLREGRVIPSRWVYNYADRVILKAGRQTYESAFWWKAFRYLQITVRNCPGGLTIESVTVRRHHYPAERKGSFTCSDPLLDRIWQTSAHTLLCCMNDAYVDCPSREQSLFLADLLVESLANYYVFGDRLLVENGLRQCARYQYANGLFPAVSPGHAPGMNDGYVDQGLAFVGNLWNYYMFTGREEILQELWPNIERLIEGIAKYLNGDGLIQGMPFNIFVDHPVFQPAQDDPSAISTGLNLIFYHTLKEAAGIAEVLHKPHQTRHCIELSQRVKQAIQDRLWDSQRGVYVEGIRRGELLAAASVQTNCLAILYDIAAPETWEHITEYVFDPAQPVVREASPYFHFYIHRMWFKMNRPARALANLRTRWGGFLNEGYTTWPETFTDPNDSKCHAYSCTPTIDLSGDVLGIRPLTPGFARFEASPRLDELEWASGAVPSTRGNIDLSWRKTGDTCRLEVLVPFGASGELRVPRDWKAIDWTIEGTKQPIPPEGGHASLLDLKAGRHRIELTHLFMLENKE